MLLAAHLFITAVAGTHSIKIIKIGYIEILSIIIIMIIISWSAQILAFFLEKGVQLNKLLPPAIFIFGEWYWSVYSM